MAVEDDDVDLLTQRAVRVDDERFRDLIARRKILLEHANPVELRGLALRAGVLDQRSIGLQLCHELRLEAQEQFVEVYLRGRGRVR